MIEVHNFSYSPRKHLSFVVFLVTASITKNTLIIGIMYMALICLPSCNLDSFSKLFNFFFSPMAKKSAFKEPMIDCIQPPMQISFPTCVCSFDLKTMKSEDLLNISHKFRLPCIVSSKFDGFIFWFDVVFEGIEKKITLSTSPENDGTHWGQVLFFTQEGERTEMRQDEVIEGEVEIKPNANNGRLLDIMLSYRCKGERNEKRYQLK